MKEIIEMLKQRKETIATMESCTGGMLANEITNIAGSSQVFGCSLVTYSSQYKIKFGVSKETIDKYTVYSKETAEEMAKSIANLANADWGIGITGYLGNRDPEGIMKNLNIVYYSVYDAKNGQFYSYKLEILNIKQTRKQKKQIIVKDMIKKLTTILK